MSEEVVYKNQWISIKKTPRGFYFAERRGKDSVAILLTRVSKEGNLEALIRYQPLPIDNSDIDQKLYACPITGSIDIGETPYQTALREVEEETGFVLDKLIELGEYVATTQSNEVVHLYWKDVTGETAEKIRFNSSWDEKVSKNQWEDFDNILKYNYSGLLILYLRVKNILNKKQ